SMPPPSSGGVAMVTMLNILEGFDLASLGHNSAPYIHLVSEAMRRAFRDRAHYLADADFVDVPVHELTSKAHGSKLRASIAADRASVSEPSDITMGYESPETTHYSV
ncbi:MAG TPA: gamma-glutamyltransferase, partial [Gemmatimonadetes bacterium]|nr:gamma-glutamyltransferase [Gemmatimonadota bacterium]